MLWENKEAYTFIIWHDFVKRNATKTCIRTRTHTNILRPMVRSCPSDVDIHAFFLMGEEVHDMDIAECKSANV